MSIFLRTFLKRRHEVEKESDPPLAEWLEKFEQGKDKVARKD